MIEAGSRVYLKRDPFIEGYEAGDMGTVIFIESQEFFYPVQVQMDRSDINGHAYYRFDYDQLHVIKMTSELAVPMSNEMDIPL